MDSWIFKSIQIPELAVSYVESIWMDFDFISQFAEEDHNYFFGKIPDAYELNKQAFYKRTIVERVLFKLMNEKSPCITISVMHGTYQRGSTLLACSFFQKTDHL